MLGAGLCCPTRRPARISQLSAPPLRRPPSAAGRGWSPCVSTQLPRAATGHNVRDWCRPKASDSGRKKWSGGARSLAAEAQWSRRFVSARCRLSQLHQAAGHGQWARRCRAGRPPGRPLAPFGKKLPAVGEPPVAASLPGPKTGHHRQGGETSGLRGPRRTGLVVCTKLCGRATCRRSAAAPWISGVGSMYLFAGGTPDFAPGGAWESSRSRKPSRETAQARSSALGRRAACAIATQQGTEPPSRLPGHRPLTAGWAFERHRLRRASEARFPARPHDPNRSGPRRPRARRAAAAWLRIAIGRHRHGPPGLQLGDYPCHWSRVPMKRSTVLACVTGRDRCPFGLVHSYASGEIEEEPQRR